MSSPYRLTTQWPRRRTSTSDLPLLPIYVPSNQELSTDSTSTPPQYKSSFTTDVEASPNKYTERKRIDSLASEPSTPGSWLENSRRTMYVNWSLFSGTIIFCVLTIAYAINASLKKPASRGLIANDPQLTIAILSGMSSLSAFLLAELVQAVFERVRWVLASRPNGLLLTEFLGMSRATSIAGVIALLAWRVNSQTSGILGRLGGSRGLWIFQRIIMFGLTAGLRLIFFGMSLSLDPLIVVNVTPTDVFIPSQTRPVFSGMTSFNSTIRIQASQPDYIRGNAIQDFVLAAFAPYRVITPDPLFGCHGPNCTGYRIHDNIEYVVVPPSNWSVNDPVPAYSSTWKHDFDPSNWDVFQVKNASTIQIEFENIDFTGAIDSLNLTCQVYGYPYLALEICLGAGSESNYVRIGTSFCPMSLEKLDCFTNQSWRLSPQFLEAGLWRQYADVAYGRMDGSIIQSTVVDGSKPIPEPFDIDGFFAIYNVTYGLADFSDKTNRTSQVEATVRYQMVYQVLAWLQQQVGVGGAREDEDNYWSTMAGRLLLLWPLVDYDIPRTSSEFTTGSSANKSTRLVILPSAVVGFLLIFLSIIIWAACCLWSVSAGVIPPNSSLFPEIDFGSKCVQFESEKFVADATDLESSDMLFNGMGVLYPLSNAESKTIVRKLDSINLYAGGISMIEMEYPHITLATRKNELKHLRCGVEYR